MNKHSAGIAAAFTAMGIVGLALLNLLFSPGYLWFYYPAFVALWWPLSAYFIPQRNHVGYALVGSALSIIFLAAVNLLNSPGHLWFLYACYPLLWWPIVIYLGRKAGTQAFSLICSAITIAYYTALNILLSPGYPWALFPLFAILWWPLSLFFARKKQWFAYSIAAGILTIAFFVIVNIISSPHVIWAIYPVFAVLWWPLSMYYFNYRKMKLAK